MSAPSSDQRHLSRVTLVLAIVLLHTAWQLPGIVEGGFQNQDVAGIAYNAQLLLGGHLPYVQSFEVKSPGAYFLFAPLLALGSMRVVWLASVLWASGTSLATGWLAREIWSERVGQRAAVLHAAGALPAALGDINYSFWMTLPFVLAATLAVRCLSLGGSRWHRALHWAAAGALAMIAFSFKHTAAALALLLLGTILVEHRRAGVARAASAAVHGLLGAGVVVALAHLPYVSAGHTSALLRGHELGASFGKGYLASVAGSSDGFFSAWLDGVGCILRYSPAALVLAVAGLIPAGRVRGGSAGATWAATGFFIAGLAATGMTLRFYRHDFVQLWPALVVLAVRPGGLVDALLLRIGRPPAALGAAAVLGLGHTALEYSSVREIQRQLGDADRIVAQTCRFLEPTLPSHEPVLGWGWSAWSVYWHCGRLAPGPIYKELGTVTHENTNTCARQRSEAIKLRTATASARYLADAQARPPSLIVISPYYLVHGGRDPITDWTAMQTWLTAHYRLFDVRAGYVFLLRDPSVEARVESP
ncbi:MAG: hypothetical protein KF718_22705 [Polyangiaceae bacterium]|nr:hypothetical protein [Polyangiaceae bacterium]